MDDPTSVTVPSEPAPATFFRGRRGEVGRADNQVIEGSSAEGGVDAVACADSGVQTEPIEYMQAWQCIGCGKLDGPQSCVGICQDHRVSLVYASEYEELRKQLEVARADLALLVAQMRQIVNTTPRHEEWKRNYHALQELARRTLEQLATGH